MRFELSLCCVVVSLDGGGFDGVVHTFDLAVGPGRVDFDEPVFDIMCLANTLKEASLCRPVLFAMGQLNAVIG